jgi:hypothetical protein
MKAVGYGVTVNGKPAGVWPLPEHEAWKSAHRYCDRAVAEGRNDVVEVVPLQSGPGLRAYQQRKA